MQDLIDKLKEAQKAWKKENYTYGIKLGYPTCCVKQFCDEPNEVLHVLDEVAGVTHKAIMRLRLMSGYVDGKYIGFIPCTLHAYKILEGGVKVEDLISKRSKDFLPFPLEGGEYPQPEL